jgi:glycosyltransferase involved in cell wall biosynthesis
MAHGCVVVSSDVGEIRTMLDDKSAVLLGDPDAPMVASSITRLIEEPRDRRSMTMEAKQIFEERFSKQRYIRTWAQLLQSVGDGRD